MRLSDAFTVVCVAVVLYVYPVTETTNGQRTIRYDIEFKDSLAPIY